MTANDAFFAFSPKFASSKVSLRVYDTYIYFCTKCSGRNNGYMVLDQIGSPILCITSWKHVIKYSGTVGNDMEKLCPVFHIPKHVAIASYLVVNLTQEKQL